MPKLASIEDNDGPTRQVHLEGTDATMESILQKTATEQFSEYMVAYFSVDPDELAKLARADHQMVRSSVAGNVYSSAETLSILANDKHREVRAAVAANPGTPHCILATLARDPERQVRLAIARSLDANLELLRELTLDKDKLVSSTAKETFKTLSAKLQNDNKRIA